MRIIQHTIQQGVNNIPLTTEYVDRVEFETNESSYLLSFIKSGRGRDKPLKCIVTENNKINESIFIACRDGLTHLSVDSSCSGVLTLYCLKNNSMMKRI